MHPSSHSRDLRHNIVIYIAILVIEGLQIVIAYRGGTVGQRVGGMLSLAIVQATLGIMFFMRMLQEKKTLRLALLSATLLVLLAMNGLWSDSFRILDLAPRAN